MNTLLSELTNAALPVILQAISGMLMAFLIWVANVARVRWGVEIEARHREALHSAIMSGLRAALKRGLTDDDVIKAAISHAYESSPDAIARLKPRSGVLRNIAEGMLADERRKALSWTGIDYAIAAEDVPA